MRPVGTNDDEANRLTRRIAERLGEPLTDEKLHAHFTERDHRGLPYTKVVALARAKLTRMVRPEHKDWERRRQEFDRLAGLPPRPRATITTTTKTGPATFDEADLLRAAQIIMDELAGYEPVLWRDVVEELWQWGMGESRQVAAKLAYDALTSLLGGVRKRWTGRPGERMVTLLPTADLVESLVGCPRCGVAAGVPCVTLGKSPRPKAAPHDARDDAAMAEASADGLDDRLSQHAYVCTACGVLNEPAAETIAALRNDIADLADRLARD